MIAIFLVIQLAIPISRFADETPRRFGWQMFTVTRQAPDFVVHTSTHDIEIDLDDFVARARGDIDLANILPAHLCNVIPDAESITWEDGHHRC